MQTIMERPERWATAVGGAALLVWGAGRLSKDRHPAGAVLAMTGAGFLLRSARGDTRSRLAGARRQTTVRMYVLYKPLIGRL